MMKHLKRFVAIMISMVMAFQFCTNDFYLYAETEPADPDQTEVTSESESEPSDSTGEAAEETPSSDIGTPEPSAPVEEQPAAPVEEQPEVASTLKVEFVDVGNASVKETVEQALESKYVKDTINLDVLGIDTNVEGYTLTEVKDKNDSTQVYTTETKDFVLTGNVTELQFVYTQNVQTDQPEDSQEPSTPQGGQEDQNSEEDQEDTDDEDSDSQTNEGEDEVKDNKVEKDNEYSIVIHHSLSTNVGIFEEYESIKIKDSDFVDGKYDLSQHEYYKAGMELSSAPVVEQDDVQSYYTVKYSVKKGYIARRVQNSDAGIFARTIYVGSFDDVIITPSNQIPVTVTAVYDSGAIAFTEVIMAEQNKSESFDFSYSPDIPEGYSVKISDEDSDTYSYNEGVLSATLPKGTESDQVTLELKANEVRYTVEHHFPGLEEDEETVEIEDDKTGPVGTQTEAEAMDKEGFVPEPIVQQEIKADGTTVVEVHYIRDTFTLTYDTQGGSYIKAKKGLYEEEIDVYSQQNVSNEDPSCGIEEHTHTEKPTYNERPGATNGCWKWRLGAWRLDCDKLVHTHSSECYEISIVYDPQPTKQGYVFAGWYLDDKHSEAAPESMELTEDTTVYAKWEPTKVNYTVSYFIENADDDNYSYLTSEVKSADVGSTVQETAETANPSGLDSENFSFFDSTSAEVKADGSTVISVYFSRNIYTIYYEWTEGWWPNQQEYKIELSAKYGAKITDEFQKTFNEDPRIDIKAWAIHPSDSADKVVCIDTMPSGGGELDGYGFSTWDQQTLYYWLENYNGEETQYHNGKTYGLYKKIDVCFNYLYESDFYDFDGYTQESYSSRTGNYRFGNDTWDGLVVDFYYDANDYQLDLFGYQGKMISSNRVKLGDSINSYLTEPEAPVEGATFNGWYLDPGHTNKYNGDYKMPQGLKLYADWIMPTYTITYKDGENQIKSEKVEYMEIPTSYSPEKDGYTFEGWYTDLNLTEEADLLAPVTGNVTVYAKWSENTTTTYTVKYVDKNGNDILDPVTESGIVGSSVTVEAKELSGDYAGYAVNKPTQTITLKADSKDNVIVFEYTSPENLSYIVQYKYGEEVIREDKGDEGQEGIPAESSKFKVYPKQEIVNELLKEGYSLTQKYQDANLVSNNEENIIVFDLELKEFKITYTGIIDTDTWGDDQNTTNPNPKTYTVNAITEEGIKITNPQRKGYEFKGWKLVNTTVKDGSEAHDPMNVVIAPGTAGNLTFEATWSEVKTQNIDGDYVDAIDYIPNINKYHQGEVKVEVYLDGTHVQGPQATTTNPLLFGYDNYDCVDVLLTYDSQYVLNAVYAEQAQGKDGGYQDIAEVAGGILVDNVQDGSTIYVYLTSKYSVQYNIDGPDSVLAPVDQNIYTIPNYVEHDLNGKFTPALNTNVTVQSLPSVPDGYTITGWVDETKSTVGTVISAEQFVNVDANMDKVITLTAVVSERTDLKYTVTYHYEGADSESSEKEGTFGKPMEYEAPEKKEYK
ncbi:hypothetical protein B5F14_10055, partial [Faecalitalea cylindroides]